MLIHGERAQKIPKIVYVEFESHTVSENQYRTPIKEHYGNEVHFTGQKPLSKRCQPLDFWYTFFKGLDLSMLEIWNL